MNLAIDASTLIAELLRKRGQAVLRRPEPHMRVAEEQWEETERGLEHMGMTVLAQVQARRRGIGSAFSSATCLEPQT